MLLFAYIREDKHTIQPIPYTFALIFLVLKAVKKKRHHPLNSLDTKYLS